MVQFVDLKPQNVKDAANIIVRLVAEYSGEPGLAALLSSALAKQGWSTFVARRVAGASLNYHYGAGHLSAEQQQEVESLRVKLGHYLSSRKRS